MAWSEALCCEQTSLAYVLHISHLLQSSPVLLQFYSAWSPWNQNSTMASSYMHVFLLTVSDIKHTERERERERERGLKLSLSLKNNTNPPHFRVGADISNKLHSANANSHTNCCKERIHLSHWEKKGQNK